MDFSGNAVVQSNIFFYIPSRIAANNRNPNRPTDYACTAEIQGFKVGNVCRNTLQLLTISPTHHLTKSKITQAFLLSPLPSGGMPPRHLFHSNGLPGMKHIPLPPHGLANPPPVIASALTSGQGGRGLDNTPPPCYLL